MIKNLSDLNADLWFVSKYAIPVEYEFGSRHFSLSQEFIKKGLSTIVVNSDSNHLIKPPKLKSTYNLIYSQDTIPTIWIKTLKYKNASSFKRVLSWIDFEIKLFILSFLLKKPKYVIISSLSILTIINGIILKKIYKVKFILEIRDIWPLTLLEIGKFKKQNIFIRILTYIEKKGYINADLIVGTMPNLKKHIYNYGLQKNVYCIPQGFRPDQIAQNLDETNKYKLPNKFIVGYTGSVGKSNALNTLIDCSLSFLKDDRIHFVIAGNGECLDEFKEKTKNSSNITFLGKIPKKDIPVLLSKVDLLYDSVKKSKIYEFGLSRNKWIDYMLASKPILASYSGYFSMINEAKCGDFVEAENTNELKKFILKYLNMSKNEIVCIGENGNKWLKKNRNFNKLASDYIRLIFS